MTEILHARSPSKGLLIRFPGNATQSLLWCFLLCTRKESQEWNAVRGLGGPVFNLCRKSSQLCSSLFP